MTKRLRGLVALLALLAVLVLPDVAYASTMLGVYGAGSDKNDVATEYLGFESYSHLDNGFKTILAGSTAGGGEGTTASPNYPNYARFRDSLSSVGGNIISPDWTWYSSYNGFAFADIVDKARADLTRAFKWWATNGDVVTGGGSYPDDDEYYIYDLSKSYSGSSTARYLYYGVSYRMDSAGMSEDNALPLDSVWRIRIHKSCIQALEQQLGSGWQLTTLIDGSYGSTGDHNVRLYLTQNRTITTTYTTKWDVQYPKLTVTAPKPFYRTVSDTIKSNYDGYGTMTIGESQASKMTLEVRDTADYSATGRGLFLLGEPFSGGGTPVEPEPDPPSNPSAPESPTYGDTTNITNEGDVTNITNNNVEYQIDLSPITERLDVINENLTEFAENMDDWWSWLNDMTEDLRKQLDGLTEGIETWLQMIYNRIPSATGTQPDPLEDDEGFWGWLLALLNQLLGHVPESLAEMLGILNELTGLFPFSVPWDIYAILAMFAHSPVTPVMSLPLPVPEIVNENCYVNLNVDFSGYDSAAQAARQVQLIAFALWLALRTPDLLKSSEKVS